MFVAGKIVNVGYDIDYKYLDCALLFALGCHVVERICIQKHYLHVLD